MHKEFRPEQAKISKDLLPETSDELSQILLFLEFSRGDSKNDVLSSYIDFDYTHTRMHLRTPDLSSAKIPKLREFIEKTLKEVQNPFPIILTGTNIFFEALGEYVVDAQILSLGITLSIIAFLFICIFGIKLGILGTLTNIFPIAFTLGSISFLGVPFDFATVLIASVSFGLCVDDTIHYLHFYLMQKKKGLPFRDQIYNSTHTLGRPIFFTSLLFALGFLVFVFSDLMILIKFGVFTALSLSLAFASTVLFLPAMLALFDSQSNTQKKIEVKPE